ncbi:Shedu anti-phage system protein SduA domain-containing protein [Streptomyces sp. NRRL S-495]|uniref:Shedu anti-phage system protein SduA domain-containing protein n=1 Tax=Streptomyces sp. NRRL S-495 TaxID=1609133 RepID=UPI000A796C98|nr:Shedu anti-phage system protein SduA domain-containing protein [Streptomyces sp. NRRL S-495]
MEADTSPARPRAIDDKQYTAALHNEWKAVLDSAENERSVQEFLEKHPALLPGSNGVAGVGGHHGPLLHCVYREPKLQGLGNYRPDFMWIARHSSVITPVCIEIEDPRKQWFTQGGLPTAEVTQAMDQLVTWKAWFDKPENELWFREFYDLPGGSRGRKPIRPAYFLIYGRNAEFGPGSRHKDPNFLSTKRGFMARADEQFMTFDRLSPDRGACNFVCVTRTSSGREVKYVPPTFETGPSMADTLLRLDGWEDAIRRTDGLEDGRADYLISRVEYWREYARSVETNGPRPYSLDLE